MSFSAKSRYQVGDKVQYFNRSGKRAHAYAEWYVEYVSVLRDPKTHDKFHLYTIVGYWTEYHTRRDGKRYGKKQRMVYQCRASMLRLDKEKPVVKIKKKLRKIESRKKAA